MDIPPKGTLLRDRYELGVRWRQMGRAIAKESPLIGLAGSVIAGWPLIRGFYPSDKAVRRSDALTGRNPRTTRIIEWTLYGLLIVWIAVVAVMAFITA